MSGAAGRLNALESQDQDADKASQDQSREQDGRIAEGEEEEGGDNRERERSKDGSRCAYASGIGVNSRNGKDTRKTRLRAALIRSQEESKGRNNRGGRYQRKDDIEDLKSKDTAGSKVKQQKHVRWATTLQQSFPLKQKQKQKQKQSAPTVRVLPQHTAPTRNGLIKLKCPHRKPVPGQVHASCDLKKRALIQAGPATAKGRYDPTLQVLSDINRALDGLTSRWGGLGFQKPNPKQHPSKVGVLLLARQSLEPTEGESQQRHPHLEAAMDLRFARNECRRSDSFLPSLYKSTESKVEADIEHPYGINKLWGELQRQRTETYSYRAFGYSSHNYVKPHKLAANTPQGHRNAIMYSVALAIL